MKHSRWILGLVCGVGLANVALASGGTIRVVTGGGVDFIYGVSGNNLGNDRFMTRYGFPGVVFPNGSEFDPNSIICGARSRSCHQSSITGSRPEECDVRIEDPNNPGFPTPVSGVPPFGAGNLNITSAGVGADSNGAPAQCPVGLSYQLFTFNGGLGCRDPLTAIFITWRQAPGIVNYQDMCWMAGDGITPYQGRALAYYTATAAYYAFGTNMWLEANVFTPKTLTLNFRMHGSSQYPGDQGQKIWFIRGDQAGTVVDDYITTSIVVDNGTGLPIGPQVLSLLADQSVINPKLTLKDMTGTFRLIQCPKSGPSLGAGNPYSWAPGRTRLEASIPATIAAKFQAMMPLQVPFIARVGPATNPGAFNKHQSLGLRGQRGAVDSGVGNLVFLVNSPSLTNDALATRFPLQRLFPRTGVSPCNTAGTGTTVSHVNVTDLIVDAATNGGRGGFDAVQLRRADPVVLNAADESPQGLLGGQGIVADAAVDVPVPVDPNGLICHLQTLPVGPITVSSADDVWILTYPMPGDTTGAGSFVCSDNQADTYLGQSFFDVAGAQPYTLNLTLNWRQRMTFTLSPFTGPGDGQLPTRDSAQPVQVMAGDRIPTKIYHP